LVHVSAQQSAHKEIRIGFIKVTDPLMSELSFLDKDTRIKDSALQEVHSRGHGPDMKLDNKKSQRAASRT